MKFQKTVKSLLIGTVLILLSTPVNAITIKSLGFNVAGELPSEGQDVDLLNNSGERESTLYTVSSDRLQQRTFSQEGHAYYVWPNSSTDSGA